MAIYNSPPSPISDFPAETTKTNQETQQNEAVKETRNDEFYKTKKIPFLGETKLIILQHKNGPCPLIAICNYLLLRGDISLHPDSFEVSQEALLSLVVGTLMDYNIDVDSNDENQQKKISNAIELLPRLVVGIDVDLKFRSVDDFEFTPELDIFGLLGIPLYHGWIPEDVATTSAIGGKSYDALTTGLVALETQTVMARSHQSSGECSVDGSASITEDLRVPSQRCVKTRSFPDSPPASAEHHRIGKGDIEEETAFLNALKLSEREALGFDTHRDSSDFETENSSKITVMHVTSSEAPISVEKTNLESTNNNIVSESESNPDLSGKSQDDDVSLYESEESMSFGSPVYEGKSILSESSSEGNETNGLTPEEGEVIKTFLDDNVSQLTWTGFFALEDKLKERELCVWFRNNHFYTMLKLDDKLYTLVTDEGYLREQNVVWERLKEINGGSVLMTGYFTVFKSNGGESKKWNQHYAISETADFIHNFKSSSTKDMDINSDLKMAMELQEQDLAGGIDSEVRMIRSKHMSSSIQEVKAVLRWQTVQSCI